MYLQVNDFTSDGMKLTTNREMIEGGVEENKNIHPKAFTVDDILAEILLIPKN